MGTQLNRFYWGDVGWVLAARLRANAGLPSAPMSTVLAVQPFLIANYVLDRIASITVGSLAALAVAAAVIVSATSGSIYSMAMPATWALLGLAAVVRPQLGPVPVFVGIAFLVLSYAGAIPFAADVPNTGTVLIVLIPMLALYTLADARSLKWVAAFGVLHGAAVIGEGLAGAPRPDGLMHNPNGAAGLLTVTAVLLARRGSLWAIIPLAAIAFTGSRWAAVVVAGVIGAMLLTGPLSWRRLTVTGSAAGIAVLLAAWLGMLDSLLRLDTLGADIAARSVVPDGVGLIPQGAVATAGLHAVPVRIAVEAGLLAGAVWFAVVGYGMGRRPRLTPSWWALLSLGALGVMDYYIWLGQLMPLLFLVLGVRVKEKPLGQLEPGRRLNPYQAHGEGGAHADQD